MALLSIILALFADRLLREWHDLRDLGWFEHYAGSLDRMIRIEHGVIRYILVMLVPVLAFGLLFLLLHGVVFNVPYFLVGIAVLIYCLGPDCLSSDVDAYIDARRLGDDDEALHLAGAITEEAASTSPDQQGSDVVRAILHVANHRIYAVLFWFTLLGPFGAVMYRLTSSLGKQKLDHLSQFADVVHAVMAWMPSRMLAVAYGLVGNFDGAMLAYKNRPYESDLSVSNYDTLVNIGLGALRHQQVEDEIAGIEAARDLVVRSILLWIAILALLTLGGLLS